MGQKPKSFDDVIEQLRKGEGNGIAVQEDGKLLPWRPGPETQPGPTPEDTPTPTRKVIWGAGRWPDPVAHQFFAAEQPLSLR